MRANVFALVLLCAGCASLPDKNDVESFASATADSASIIKTAVAASAELAKDQDEQLQALEYVRGRPFRAGHIPDSPEVKRLDPAQLAIRISALKDLQSYAKALSQATDQGTIAEVEAASEKLATSVGALATAISPAASPVIQPVAQLTGHAIGYAFADRYVRQVLDIVRKTDPTIKELVSLLKDDLGPLPQDLKVQADAYAGLREAQIATIGDDKRVNRAERYEAYTHARADIKARYALSVAAEPVSDLLQSIYDTHHALAVGSADITLTISRMTTLANDVGAVVGAAKKDAGQ